MTTFVFSKYRSPGRTRQARRQVAARRADACARSMNRVPTMVIALGITIIVLTLVDVVLVAAALA